MPILDSKWIDYGSTTTNTTDGVITDLPTSGIRQLRFTQADIIDSLANGVTAGQNLSREIIITNASPSPLTIKNNGLGNAANRILTGTGADVTLPAGASIYLRYDTAVSLWRAVGDAAGDAAATQAGVTNKIAFYETPTSINDTSSAYWDNVNGRLGVGPASPEQKLHVTGGSTLVDHSAEAGYMVKYNGNLNGNANITNPVWTLGRLVEGGVPNKSVFRFIAASDDMPERSVFEVEDTGTAASVSDGTRRSHFEAFLNNGDTQPIMRISSSVGGASEMGLQFGVGGTTAPDVQFFRNNTGPGWIWSLGGTDKMFLYPDALVTQPGVNHVLEHSGGLWPEMRFKEDISNGSHYVGFKAPQNILANQIWELPAADGTAGFVLSTNGSGVTSWVANGGGGGTVSAGDTGKIPYYTGPTTIDDTASGAAGEGAFWDNTQRTMRIGATVSNPGLGTRSLMVGQSLTNNEVTNGSIIFGFSNTMNLGTGGNGSLIGGSSNTVVNVGAGIVSGQSNNVDASPSSIIFGNSNVVTQSRNSLVGGNSNRVSSVSPGNTGSTALGGNNRVFGSYSHALGGNSTSNINRVPGDSAFLTGGDDSGNSLHAANSAYSQVEGKGNLAGYKSYAWARYSAAYLEELVIINTASDYVQPREFVNGVQLRFFDLSPDFSGTVLSNLVIDVPCNIYSYAYPNLTVQVTPGSLLLGMISGRVMVRDGGEYANASGHGSRAYQQGQHSQANGMFSVQGDAQTSILTLRRSTTTNALLPLFLNVTASSGMYIPPYTTWGFTITVVGRRAGAPSSSAMFKYRGMVSRIAGVPVLVLDPVSTALKDVPAWDCTITAGGVDTLNINVLGEAGVTINWVARVELTEITLV